MKRLSLNSGAIIRIFLLFKKTFNRDQCNLEFLWAFINIFGYLLVFNAVL